MTPRKVGVLGPGAIGGLLAARLSKAGHEVTVIATERTAIAIELTGLKLRTPHDEIETKPIARPWLTAPVEVLFVTTRATDLPAALERREGAGARQVRCVRSWTVLLVGGERGQGPLVAWASAVESP